MNVRGGVRTISEPLAQNGIPTTVKQHFKALDELGGLDVLGSPIRLPSAASSKCSFQLYNWL